MPPVQYHQTKVFPPDNLDPNLYLPFIGPAHAALARYDGILTAIPNASVLLAPLTTQEAVLSSRIEGTQATFGEVLQFEAGNLIGDSESKEDILEVLNYRAALQHAVLELESLPLSQRLLRNAHRRLLQGVRMESKAPGEYRKVENSIGPPGCTIDTARYVPISAEKVLDAMSRWERFIHASFPDALVKLAILHAEFEAIHPFLDGNGRLGRLLIPLYLFEEKILSTPNFYMSAYFESHRDEYYDKLLAVSRDGAWTEWCVYFLTAVIAQAKNNYNRAFAIIKLYQDLKPRFTEKSHSQYAIQALDWFFSRPIFKASDFAAQSSIPKPTAIRLIRIAREESMLSVLAEASGRRSAYLCFDPLLQIVDSGDIH